MKVNSRKVWAETDVIFDLLERLSNIFDTKNINIHTESFEGNDGYYPCISSITYICIGNVKWPL